MQKFCLKYWYKLICHFFHICVSCQYRRAWERGKLGHKLFFLQTYGINCWITIYIRVLPDIRQPDIRAPDMAIFRISGISGSGNCFAGYPAGYPVSGSCRIFRILYCFFGFVSVTSNTYHHTVADMKAAREDYIFPFLFWLFGWFYAARVCVFLVLLDSTWKCSTGSFIKKLFALK